MINQGWNLLYFGPINLWNFPRQNKDYMTYTEERRRSNALKLRPTRKPTKAQHPVITPAYGEAHNMVMERMMRCMDSRNGVRR